ncbi:MAG: acetate--CoA ligase [Acidobacteria bacterium RIFCSPLOWO2_02_FULL_59_13]|nr:MAG: acetate--CoA ligase [Acidobacteria bacterium RIFCSPLOWO2_02_FULL_59_13]
MDSNKGAAAGKTIEALYLEERKFAPPAAFRQQAVVADEAIYEKARQDPDAFWAEQAEALHWFKKWEQVRKWEPPWVQWFVGGKLNASYNCLDRHVETWRRNKAAIIWEGEPGDDRVLTYADLYREVNKFANVLKKLGVRRGDRVAIYMPMIPELAIALLACARLGAPHTVVFGGFSPESLRGRINDAEARVVITSDGGYRRGGIVPIKQNVDEALKECPAVKDVVMVRRVGDAANVHFEEGRDHWWHRLMQDAPLYCPPEEMDSEDPLYILYTSGTTAQPKGIVHTTGGYMVGVSATHRWIFDIREEDVFWCTADIGWVTGHSYIVYGPLSAGTTCVMYEGTPDWPAKDRFWQIVEKYRVSILYTAPTAIRTFMGWGNQYPAQHDLTSLRLIGSVGEPINPEAWMWYYEHIGGKRCPVVDTWWQTETGMILISPLPGITTLKPGSATFPLPGIEADVVDENGQSVPLGGGGYLVLRAPWPAIARTIYKDPDRYIRTYFSRFGPSVYLTGDGAKRDQEGYFWLLGRVDDVMNISGHRVSTAEVESALVSHPSVAEAAVIGKPHAVKGQAISAFVTLRAGVANSPDKVDELKRHVAEKIGALARPEDIFFTAELPKTRSGKIMRRLLRDIAEGRTLGDTTTLADPAVVTKLRTQYEESAAE